ncbi:chemotaxis protein CheW [Marinobacter halodurans]|uniref:chemotaxis protein CheW n=1 Tax=Marinobacter halodurans TaxID=2528979 RepID=UPI001F60C1D5|nr:chemotaxis protein CheW [Marinobacter halodurans]
MCGVLNLRGIIVPIVDLRLFFGMPFVEYCGTTVVVVLKVMHEEGQRIVDNGDNMLLLLEIDKMLSPERIG